MTARALLLLCVVTCGACVARPVFATPAPEDSAFAVGVMDTLAYIHPTHPPDNREENFRTRFTFRPETRTEGVEFLRRRLAAILEPAGGTVALETFTAHWAYDTVTVTGTATNVVGRLPGSDVVLQNGGNSGRPVVVIGGHHDSSGLREGSQWIRNWQTLGAPGVDDNATGCAAVLLAAQSLVERRFPFDLIFAFWDAEEIGGLQGSADFVRARRAAGDSVLLAIDIDEIGFNPDYLRTEVIENGQSRWFARWLRQADSLFACGLEEVVPVYVPGLANSDHHSFWTAGLQAVSFAEHYQPEFPAEHFRGHNVYDTRRDTADSIRVGLVTGVADVIRRAVGEYAEGGRFAQPALIMTDGDVAMSWQRRYAGAPPLAGQTIGFRIMVHNAGGGGANVPVRWRIRDRAPDGRTVRLLATGDTLVSYMYPLHTISLRTLWASDKAQDVGTHRIEVELDPIPGSGSSQPIVATASLTLVGETPHVFSVRAGASPLHLGVGLPITYQLATDGDVAVDLLRLDGQIVSRAQFTSAAGGGNGAKAGENRIVLPVNTASRPLAPGVYIVRVRTYGGTAETTSTGVVAITP
jgi:hypothetical protein